MSPKRSWEEERLIERFQEFIRFHEVNTLFVRGDAVDHLLETDVVYAHPSIPPLAVSHVKNRLDADPHFDGEFLCVVLDIRHEVPVELCVLTSRALIWWEEDTRSVHKIGYDNLGQTYPVTGNPFRGLRVCRLQGQAGAITLSLHDALLNALADFLNVVTEMKKPPLLDLNSATEEQIATLPMMNPGRAQRIVAEREAIHGFKRLGQIAQLLDMHPQEFHVLETHATIKPYQIPYRPGRRVDY